MADNSPSRRSDHRITTSRRHGRGLFRRVHRVPPRGSSGPHPPAPPTGIPHPHALLSRPHRTAPQPDRRHSTRKSSEHPPREPHSRNHPPRDTSSAPPSSPPVPGAGQYAVPPAPPEPDP